MSTTFGIYPSSSEIPTFGQVLDLTTHELARRFESLQVSKPFQLTAVIRCSDETSVVVPELHCKFEWPDNTYLWFGIDGVDGGTDGYFENIDELTREVWNDYFLLPHFARRKKMAIHCLSIGHYWSFRRSMGQLGITSLLYGVLSGCVAKLTDGLIMSDDSAWEWNKMPYTADEFLTEYFVPHRTDDHAYREWAERCLAGLTEDLAG